MCSKLVATFISSTRKQVTEGKGLSKVTLDTGGICSLGPADTAPGTHRQTAPGRRGALSQDRISGNGSAEQGRRLKQENSGRKRRPWPGG